jgi:hypothetical protein
MVEKEPKKKYVDSWKYQYRQRRPGKEVRTIGYYPKHKR